MLVNFELTGKSDILFHKDDVEASDEVRRWQKDPANKDRSIKGDDRSPPWTWMTYLYHDGEHIAFPSDNLMTCLRQAGGRMILKGSKTYKEVTQSGLCPEEEYLTFLNSKRQQVNMADVNALRDLPFSEQYMAVKDHGFGLFVKRAKNPGSGSKHIRVRARFSGWVVAGTIEVIEPDILTREILTQLFEIAGKVGLGDWRPGCKTPGVFGRFDAKLKFKA